MPECSASVRIATEPVSTPATTLSAISGVLETIETAAARLRARACCVRRVAVQRVQPCEELPRGVPAVGDRVLLRVARAPPSCARASRRRRTAGRSRSRPPRAARRPACPRSAPRTACSSPSGRDVGDHAHVARAAAGGRLAVQLGQVLAVAWRPRPRSARCGRPGASPAPRPRSRSRRRTPAARSPARPRAALISAFSA